MRKGAYNRSNHIARILILCKPKRVRSRTNTKIMAETKKAPRKKQYNVCWLYQRYIPKIYTIMHMETLETHFKQINAEVNMKEYF